MGFLSKNGLKYLLKKITHAENIRVDSNNFKTVQDMADVVDTLSTSNSISDLKYENKTLSLSNSEGDSIGIGVNIADVMKNDIPTATIIDKGLMSSEDKEKLNAITLKSIIVNDCSLASSTWTFDSKTQLYFKNFANENIKESSKVDITIQLAYVDSVGEILPVTKAYDGGVTLYSREATNPKIKFDMLITTEV